MKLRHLLTAAAAILLSTALLAEQPVRRTIILKDGKVISNGEVIDLPAIGGKRPVLGVVLSDITPELREYYGAPRTAGVLVGAVEKGSPAERAGLRVGDIVLSIDGQDVTSPTSLRRALQGKKEGDSVRIDFLRSGARQTAISSVVEREGPRIIAPVNIEELVRDIGTKFDGPEWRARVEQLGNCGDLQIRIRELETRLRDLEKRLQK